MYTMKFNKKRDVDRLHVKMMFYCSDLFPSFFFFRNGTNIIHSVIKHDPMSIVRDRRLK